MAVPEARREGRLDASGDKAAVVVRLEPLSHGDRVRVGEQQPKVLRPFGETPDIAAAVPQIVDELPPSCLLMAEREPLRTLVPLREGVHGLLRRCQQVIGQRAAQLGPYVLGG